jgi:phospholipase C
VSLHGGGSIRHGARKAKRNCRQLSDDRPRRPDGRVFVEQSSYASSTLVLLTWDEGGGFFDHVPPPAPVPTTADEDGSGKPTPYGTRVPLLAIGPFTRKGTVSHVPMEHSSIVRFLEYNFLGHVGQLEARDAVVNNMGSLLDPAATGITIPEK